MATAVAYFIASLFTGLIGFNLFVSAITFGSICFGLSRAFAGLLAMSHPKRFGAAVSLVSMAVIAALLAYPTLTERFRPPDNNATSQVIEALRLRTLALDTVQAGRGFEDLQPLSSILQGKRIIALGEATHGTREFFQMKHRLLEFLVREMGVENFGMETSPDVAQVVNDYINNGSGNPRDVLYWPWATTEVMDMLDWMRAYNADPLTARRITFYGIDPTTGDRDRVMAVNVGRILDQMGPQSKIVLWAHNAHISESRESHGVFSQTAVWRTGLPARL